MTQRPNGLLEEVRDGVRLEQYPNRTEKTCLYSAKCFALYRQNRHPRDMREQVSQSFTYLPVAEHVAPSTQDRALVAAPHLC